MVGVEPGCGLLTFLVAVRKASEDDVTEDNLGRVPRTHTAHRQAARPQALGQRTDDSAGRRAAHLDWAGQRHAERAAAGQPVFAQV
jgi:hypothetical protein